MWYWVGLLSALAALASWVGSLVLGFMWPLFMTCHLGLVMLTWLAIRAVLRRLPGNAHLWE